MRRIILIAENCEPLGSKITRRSITKYDRVQAWLTRAATGIGIILGAIR
jgi:hypothetical protein